jgi:two-component system, response regulator FlrC
MVWLIARPRPLRSGINMLKTILLVDDDIDLLNSIAEVLRMRGYFVLEHSDPREALESVRMNENLDCVLTDVEMPGMDGVSLLAEVRRIHPTVEGLLMTGNIRWWGPASSDDIDYLRKPFSCEELLEAIEDRLVS